MRTFVIITVCFFSISGTQAQDFKLMGKKVQDSIKKKERLLNVYANRKYNFCIAENLYGNLPGYHPFGRFDITFEDRVPYLDSLLGPGRFEMLAGIGFQPYQGTVLHLGSIFELFPGNSRASLYVGGQYSLGLAQSTTMVNNSTIDLGFHNYLMPFIGIKYWPASVSLAQEVSKNSELYRKPGILQLFFFKLQVGYSFLLSSKQISTTGAFDGKLLEQIRINTGNTLQFKLGLGINIPSLGKRKNDYDQMQQNIKGLNFY